jgi:glycosyltransferase involved in cell wall biosynthesis
MPDLKGDPVRVAIAHEWLVRYAGSERCVEQLMLEFPGAQLLTTVIDRASMPELLRGGEPSVLQAFGGARSRHEWFVPLMPLSWKLRPTVSEVDAVVVSSHACARSVKVGAGIPVTCYCHTPMRYAWDFAAESSRFPPYVRSVVRAATPVLQRWDRSTAQKVHTFVANSSAVAKRIQLAYGRRAAVVFPPVDTEYFCYEPTVEPARSFLYVGRLVSYKQADLVVEAFRDLPYRLDVVGEGHLLERLRSRATPNITFRGEVRTDELRDLYRRACALVYPADEDFGLVMAEAQSCGTPVIGSPRGGALDIVIDGATGLLVAPRTDALQTAISALVRQAWDRPAIAAGAARFSAERFRAQMREIVEASLSSPPRL